MVLVVSLITLLPCAIYADPREQTGEINPYFCTLLISVTVTKALFISKHRLDGKELAFIVCPFVR